VAPAADAAPARAVVPDDPAAVVGQAAATAAPGQRLSRKQKAALHKQQHLGQVHAGAAAAAAAPAPAAAAAPVASLLPRPGRHTVTADEHDDGSGAMLRARAPAARALARQGGAAPVGNRKRRRDANEDQPHPQPPPAAGAACSGTMCALHRSRLFHWDPSPVAALAACPDGSAVALATNAGAAELWDAAHWCCIARVPGCNGVELSGLAWVQDPVDGRCAQTCGRVHISRHAHASEGRLEAPRHASRKQKGGGFGVPRPCRCRYLRPAGMHLPRDAALQCPGMQCQKVWCFCGTRLLATTG
jgi:hypothetical protein